MTRQPRRSVVAPLLLAFALGATQAHAFDWPWEEKPEVRYAYCKGFVVAALGDFPLDKLSRTRLWLAWNTINRTGIPPTTAPGAEYQSGFDQFHQWLAAGSFNQIRQTADGDCALGRN